MDLQQWGVILVTIGFVFFLSYREYIRSKILLPDQQIEGYGYVVKLVSNAQKYVKIIDLYPGDLTIKAISVAQEGIPVKWLTLKLYDKQKQAEFEALALKLIRIRKEVEIRYAPKGKLHDRYILTEPHGWALGQSIKDIGKKLSSIHLLSEQETLDVVRIFDTIWEEATSIDEEN